jgi:hypothetical protein
LLAERLEAGRADVDLARLALEIDRVFLDVRLERPVGRSLGMADIVSEIRAFTANLTFGHRHHLIVELSGAIIPREPI